MADERDDFGKVKRDVGAIVAVAIVAVAVGQGGFDWVISAIQHSKLEAGADDYIEFGQLYLSTFFLSATLTAAMAIWIVPPLYGTTVHWMWPILVLVAGAALTGQPVRPQGGTPAGWAVGALATFADYYGTAFWGGLVVGAAGGLIVYRAAQYAKSR